MKKKTTGRRTGLFAGNREKRHKLQEDEYGRDEFLFGAEEDSSDDEYYEEEEDEYYEDEEYEAEEYDDGKYNSDEYDTEEYDSDEFDSDEYDHDEVPETLNSNIEGDAGDPDDDDPDFYTRDLEPVRTATASEPEEDEDYDFYGEALALVGGYEAEKAGIGDDGDYDDEYENEDYNEKAVPRRKTSSHRSRRKKKAAGGFFGSIAAFFTNMSMADRLIAATGVCVLVIAIVTGSIYVNARTIQKQVDSFADIGSDLNGVEIIGDSGLTASVEARAALMSIQETEEAQEEETEETEEETEEVSSVVMKVSSIQSDLKIKFTDKTTEKLISGIVFKVTVTSDKNKTYEWSDDNKDGLIYHTDVPNGTYKVEMAELTGDDAEKYSAADAVTGVKVTDTIAYKKVDVADEVKSESEVNAAAEDTGVQDTAIESSLTDTVEWVESSKTLVSGSEDGYTSVDKSNIVNPDQEGSADPSCITLETVYCELPYAASQSQTIDAVSLGTSDDEEDEDEDEDEEDEDEDDDGDEDEEEKSEVSVSVSPGSASIEVGSSITLSDTVKGADDTSVVWTSSNDSVASVSGGTVTGIAEGSAVITVTSVADGSKSASCSITVKASSKKDDSSEKSEVKISLSKSSLSLKVKESESLSVTVSGTGNTSVEWSSDDSNIASVSNGKVTGTAVGTTTITVTSKEDSSKSASCKVTVTAASDSSAKLLTKDGKQVYIKNSSGKYVEATAADYSTAKNFYIKGSGGDAVYSYTGWQTIDGYTYFFDKNGNYVTGEQVIQGARYTFDSNGHLTTGSGTMGIDVSKWNGSIDWTAVKNSGVSYAIIRCGYRGSSTGALIEDPKFRSNISGAKAAGIAVGAYFYTQAVNEVEAVEEASMAVSLCSGYGLSLPIFLDVEGSGGRGDSIDAGTRTAVCKAFCQTVKNSGFGAGIYANKTWLSSRINTSQLTSYKIWLAQYAASPTYTATRYDYWQYSSKGKVSGISGNVDLNIRY